MQVQRYHSDSGFMMIESMGALLFYLIMIGAVAVIIGMLMSGGKLSEMQQGLSSVRMQTQQLFSGASDYSGLNSELAVKAGIIPKRFRKGDQIQNPWGGKLSLEAGTDIGTFIVTVEKIPQEECTKLANYERDTWDQITINGSNIDKSSTVASVAAACGSSNTITYQSR